MIAQSEKPAITAVFICITTLQTVRLSATRLSARRTSHVEALHPTPPWQDCGLLEQEPLYFHDRYTTDPLILFRIFNYPPETTPETPSWVVGEHTDYGLLTILKQDELGGLPFFFDPNFNAALQPIDLKGMRVEEATEQRWDNTSA